MSRRQTLLGICEWGVATSLAAGLVWIHAQNWIHAAMLWRDEITTLHIATQPSLGGVWSLTEWESLPLLWPLTLRTWIGLGLGDDAQALRLLSLVVGLGIIASLFFALRRMAGTLPLLALLLVAANPSVIRFGDTLRGYGLGLLLVILLVVAFWELALRVTRGRTIAAALLAILAVQCLYHDAVLVLALCAACAAAWCVRRRYREAAIPLAIGGFAALTLLPYLGPLGRAREWNIVFRMPVDLVWLAGKLRETVEVGGPWIPLLWAGLTLSALVACARPFWSRTPDSESLTEQRARAVFLSLALVVGVAGYATFLILVGYPTQSWYYLSLVGLAGVLIETSFELQAGKAFAWRAVRLGIVVAGLAVVAPVLWRGHPLRMTNLDRVAAALAVEARPDDLILVTPWYLGISFDHYYTGPTPWLSVPDLSDRTLTRYDLVKEQMTRPEAARAIADRAQKTLQGHGRVWVVGDLPLIEGNPPVPAPPIAPDSPLGWSERDYQFLWSRAVAHRLQEHATGLSRIPIEGLGAVSPFENPPLYLFEASP